MAHCPLCCIFQDQANQGQPKLKWLISPLAMRGCTVGFQWKQEECGVGDSRQPSKNFTTLLGAFWPLFWISRMPWKMEESVNITWFGPHFDVILILPIAILRIPLSGAEANARRQIRKGCNKIWREIMMHWTLYQWWRWSEKADSELGWIQMNGLFVKNVKESSSLLALAAGKWSYHQLK